jgi:hypothetical protein
VRSTIQLDKEAIVARCDVRITILAWQFRRNPFPLLVIRIVRIKADPQFFSLESMVYILG